MVKKTLRQMVAEDFGVSEKSLVRAKIPSLRQNLTRSRRLLVVRT